MLAIFSKAGRLNSNNQKFQFWQQDNHPIEVYSNKVINEKMNYIHNNPVTAEIVSCAEHYSYSSARDYAEEKGFVRIELMEYDEYVGV